MGALFYVIVRAVVWVLQCLPLKWVARIGRSGGLLAYALDARHRRVAVENLKLCFGQEMTRREIRSIAKENFQRLGENYCCAIKTAAMSWDELRPHVDFAGVEEFRPLPGQTPANLIVAIGHFGNFELYARFGEFIPGYQCATTYRGLDNPRLNELMQSLRKRSGALFFDRRTDGAALRSAMAHPGLILGLLADQHAGKSGLWLPFFGHDCSTTPSPAIFALRYRCRLFTGFCYRTGMARWRIEPGPEIATHANGKARPVSDMTLEINQAFEAAVRRDPANWFWVHKRWKTPRSTSGLAKSEQGKQLDEKSPVAGAEV